jgi:hypothetical protein
MSDRQYLLLVLVLLYLSECVQWVRRGGVVFRRALGPWTARAEADLVRNDRGDLHWTWPLPMFGEFFVAHGPPFSIGPEGVLNFTAPSLHPGGRPLVVPRWIAWSDIKTLEARGKTLRVNGEVFWISDSGTEPRRLLRLLDELRRVPPDKREAAIRERIDTAFDRPALRARRTAVETATGGLRSACLILWLAVFGVAPVAVWRWGWLPPLLVIVPMLLGLMIGITVWMRRISARLSPEAEDERFKYSMVFSLSPAAAIRAVDVCRRPVLEPFHPLAVGAELLTRDDWAAFAAGAWRDLQFPRRPECPLDDPRAMATEKWFRDRLRERFRALAADFKLDPAAWERPPASTDPTHRLYCARCQAQFTASATQCADCGGRPLVALAG